MKSLIVLALAFSSAAFALSPVPLSYKSTEVLSCAQGNETLSVQILTHVTGSDNFALLTFVDYRKNNQVAYSTISYMMPDFIPAGAGGFKVNGIGDQAGRVLYFGYDNMSVVAQLDGVFSFTNCKDLGTIGRFTNLGIPRVEPVKPAPAKPAPYKPTPYRKI